MKKTVCKGIAVMLTLLMLTAVGCTKKVDVPQEPVKNPVTVDEAKALLNKLIPQAFETYDIFFNGGIKMENIADTYPEDECFKVIDERFKNIEDVKAYTETTFTQEYAYEQFYKLYIDGTKDYEPQFMMRGDELWYRDSGMTIRVEWLIDTTKIISQTNDTLTLSVERTDHDESEGFKEIILKKTNGEWRVASDLV